MHQFTASQRIKNTLSYKIGLELIHTDKKLKEKNTLIKFTLGGGLTFISSINSII
ncbi:hypothetical protein [Campylobacter sp. MIT 97-5078]|uniref:hypothetical protein n=1 Tax=Campylobacter sp. MIT 97-5078 TaxID=1548153 RepID=UPI000AE44A0C|nr:hypothetical protein [Campylobacter sp. MIT 97-5078]